MAALQSLIRWLASTVEDHPAFRGSLMDPIVFCETRQFAEEWTYRFLAAARAWAETEGAALQRIAPAEADTSDLAVAPVVSEASTAEV